MMLLLLSLGTAHAGARTVLDVYLALPIGMFQCEGQRPDTAAFRRSLIAISDVQNGYIRANIDDEMAMEVALFADRHGGHDLVVVNKPCGEGCMCNLFGVYDTTTMTSVREKVFPSDSAIRSEAASRGHSFDGMPWIVLPRRGTTVLVEEHETGEVVLKITWDGAGGFHIAPA